MEFHCWPWFGGELIVAKVIHILGPDGKFPSCFGSGDFWSCVAERMRDSSIAARRVLEPTGEPAGRGLRSATTMTGDSDDSVNDWTVP